MSEHTLANLVKLPAIQEAIRAAEAADEATAAAARKSVLDQLAAAEAELKALNDQAAEFEAEQDLLKERLASLNRQRTDHAIVAQGVNSRRAELARDLHWNHGGSMISTVILNLGSKAAGLRSEAAYLKSLRRPEQNRFGDVVRKPDADAIRKAEAIQEQADAIEQVVAAIRPLEREPLAPQEIRRRIEAELHAIGMNVHMEASKTDAKGVGTWEPPKNHKNVA